MKYLNSIGSPDDLKKLSINSLDLLCREIRKFLIESISKTGGHLASNLGVVELTVALHYCFDSPKDKIIWDVGHQAYVHKIITGRKQKFHKLRQLDGLSGFPKCKESPHDAFDTGHSSTSISVGLGYAVSRDLAGDNYSVISVIGDGSMTGGLAFEALNNAGRSNSNMIVILNDNQMSISENVGALSRRLNEMRTASYYLEAKEDVNNFLHKIPKVGSKIGKIIEKTKDGIKYLLVPGVLFEEFGFKYVGPVDGHNLKEMIDVLSKIKHMSGPVLLHVYTTKGKGYGQAEKAPSKYHGVDSFDIQTGDPLQTKIWDTYSEVFGKTLISLAEKNKKIVAVTAAMPSGTGLSGFQKRFPERLFDVGIAEAHAVTFAAGMAKNGLLPVFAVYSTFLQRGYDQIIHDVCLQGLHVIFAIDRAGIVGSDGDTHQGVFDLSFLSHIPNMTVMSPKNKGEMIAMLDFATKHNGPIAICYPRGAASRVLKYCDQAIELGKCEIIYQGKEKKLAIISLGSMMDTAYEVFNRLKESGYDSTLINARFVKPLDREMVQALRAYKCVFVLEDNLRAGGLGSKILEALAEENSVFPQFYSVAFPDEYIEQGERDELFKKYQMDSDNVYAKMVSVIGRL